MIRIHKHPFAHLWSTQLDVARVHLLAQHLVDGLRAREDDRLSLDLDHTLTQPDEVRSNTHRTGRDHRDGEDVVVRARSLTGDETRSAETLDTKTVLETDDRRDLVTVLAIDHDLVGDDRARAEAVELLEVLVGEVEVVKAFFGLARLPPGDVKQTHDLLGETDSGTRVGREVDAGQAVFASVLGGLEEVLVLGGAERADLVRRDLDVRHEGHERPPGLLDRLSEQVGEVVHVGGADDVRLVTTGLERLLGRVGEVDGLEVELTLLADRLEDGDALLVGDLLVRLVLDDKAGNVLDKRTDGKNVALVILDDDADLGLGHTQTPQSLAVTLNEARKGLLDIIKGHVEAVHAVDADVVAIRLAELRRRDLEGVEDVADEAVRLRDEVLGLLHVAEETAGAEESAHKEADVGRVLAADGVVDVDLPVGGRLRGDLEVGQTTQLKLVRQCRFDVSDRLFLLPAAVGRLAKGVVRRILVLAADGKGDSPDALADRLGAVLVDQRVEVLVELGIGPVLGAVKEAQGDVHDVRVTRLFAVLFGKLVVAKGRVHGEELAKALLEVGEVVVRGHETETCRLLAGVDDVAEVAHAGDAGDVLHRVDARGDRLGGVATHLESPGDNVRLALLTDLVVEVHDVVDSVRTTDVHLESRDGNPRVLVVEKGARVGDLLEDVAGWEAVTRAGLAVVARRDRRLEQLLQLGETLLVARQTANNHDFLGLERDLGGRAAVERGEAALALDEVEQGQDELGLGRDLGVRQDELDDLVEVLVLVTELENNVLLRAARVGERLLNIGEEVEEVGPGLPLVDLEAVCELSDDHLERGNGVADLGPLLGCDVLLDKVVDRTPQLEARELLLPGTGRVYRRAGLLLELGRDTAAERGHDVLSVGVRQVGVAQGLLDHAERGDDGGRVVKAGQVVVEHLELLAETLVRLGAVATVLELECREDALERLGKFDLCGVVEGEDTEQLARGKCLTGLLHELGDTALAASDRHDHLHDLDLGVRLAGVDVVARVDEVADELTRARGAELGRVLLVLDHGGLGVDGEDHRADLLAPVDGVRSTLERDEETAVAERAAADKDAPAVQVQGERVLGRLCHGERVSDVLVDELGLEERLEGVLGRDLTLVEDRLVPPDGGLVGDVGLDDGTADDGDDGVGSLRGHTLGNEPVEPLSGDGVVLKLGLLEELDEVLDRRAELSPDGEFLERDDHRLARLATLHAVGEDVTELRIGIFVQTTGGRHGKVTPDVRVGAEVELGEVTRRRLEPGVRVLTGDTTSNDVTLGGRLALGVDRLRLLPVKVNVGDAVRIHAVEGTDVADAVEGQTHGNLELDGRDVAARDHLGGGMLDLESGVELEEVERVLLMRIEVLDGTGRDVADELGEADSGLFHLLKLVARGDGDGGLLDDLLVTTLDRAVTAEEGDGVAVLVGDELDLEMASGSGELHDEDGGA
ncbi:hypothetical protein JCM24511_04876 [Saitozyma sp. JCM 24511]|nr:hypothetical protein JCM24511_04876 [Saitozyma sp. JCM 24511]